VPSPCEVLNQAAYRPSLSMEKLSHRED
jgi:hypothetical protein